MRAIWKFLFGFAVFVLLQALLKEEVLYAVITTVIVIITIYRLVKN